MTLDKLKKDISSQKYSGDRLTAYAKGFNRGLEIANIIIEANHVKLEQDTVLLDKLDYILHVDIQKGLRSRKSTPDPKPLTDEELSKLNWALKINGGSGYPKENPCATIEVFHATLEERSNTSVENIRTAISSLEDTQS